jgi:hypothetical protein
MTTIGFNQPLYVLPFDHRGSFQAKMFGWPGSLTAAQTAEIAPTKQVIYDGFKAALEAGVPERKAGLLVDERFRASILRDAIILGRGENDQKVRAWLPLRPRSMASSDSPWDAAAFGAPWSTCGN